MFHISNVESCQTHNVNQDLWLSATTMNINKVASLSQVLVLQYFFCTGNIHWYINIERESRGKSFPMKKLSDCFRKWFSLRSLFLKLKNNTRPNFYDDVNRDFTQPKCAKGKLEQDKRQETWEECFPAFLRRRKTITYAKESRV